MRGTPIEVRVAADASGRASSLANKKLSSLTEKFSRVATVSHMEKLLALLYMQALFLSLSLSLVTTCTRSRNDTAAQAVQPSLLGDGEPF